MEGRRPRSASHQESAGRRRALAAAAAATVAGELAYRFGLEHHSVAAVVVGIIAGGIAGAFFVFFCLTA